MNQPKSFFLIAAILLGCLALTSCHTPDSMQTQTIKGERPQMLTVYFPYGPALNRECEATPLPNYRGWYIDRMEKDFKRLADVGFDAALVAVRLDGFAKSSVPTRIETLLTLAGKNPQWPAIGFFGYQKNQPTQNDMQAFLNWALATKMKHRNVCYKLNNRPLFVLADNVEWRPRHPALAFRHAATENGEWPTDNMQVLTTQTGKKENAWISPAPSSNRACTQKELKKQRDARRFKRQLHDLIAADKFERITVYSWNDYTGATFIEPNTIDYYEMTQAIYQTLRNIKQNEKEKHERFPQ